MEYIEKVLGMTAGVNVRVSPDRILITDGPGHEAAEKIMGLCTEAAFSGNVLKGDADAVLKSPEQLSESVKDRISVIFDHDVPCGSFSNAFIQKHLISFAKENALEFTQAEGVGYQLMYSKINSGEILAGCGQHNSFVGAKGAIGISLSEDQMAGLLTEGSIELTVPETIHITLKGKLAEGVSAYDAALSIAAKLISAAGGKAIEYSDMTEGGLSEDDKKLICMFAQRCGAFCAYFGEGDVKDAETDLSQIRQVIGWPAEALDERSAVKSQGTVKLMDSHADVSVNACFIGGCAGGRIEDLRIAAGILKGKRIKRELRLTIGFVDNDTFLKAVHEGLIDIFFDAGAQVTNPGCASCRSTSIGVIGDGEVLATTGCYSYRGCIGTDNSSVYIASVGSVAKAALTGVLSVN
jgi:3-isopropylmalate/(R)-2-methylmalate dehydratase large subunit